MILARRIIVLLALFAFAATQLAASSHASKLSRAQVLRLAERAAKREGYTISDYRAPTIQFESIHQDHTWTVFYMGRALYPGNHFWVVVDDRTQKTVIMGGE